MEVSSERAVTGLVDALNSLVAGQAGSQPAVTVLPTKIALVGLNGFVGRRGDPEKDVFGKRVEADVTVSVSSDGTSSLDQELARVRTLLLGSARGTLLNLGILSIAPNETAATTSSQQPDEPGEVHVKVVYEFLAVPDDDEITITSIPITIEPA